MMIYRRIYIIALLIPFCAFSQVQLNKGQHIKAQVNFDEKLQEWDGFGINYVETSQTFDFTKYEQDYGGFSILDQSAKDSISKMVFGFNGLDVDLVKMFLDPFHKSNGSNKYNHEITTKNMRAFVQSGNKIKDKQLEIITTLYCPPGYMTLQNELRGRDLNPNYLDSLLDYMIDWAIYLLKDQDLNVKYLSLHNEGESWQRWDKDGRNGIKTNIEGHDYNLFWDKQQLIRAIIKGDSILKCRNIEQLFFTPGETTNWYRLWAWGYAAEIAQNNKAIDGIGLISSHGFYVGDMRETRWFGPHSSLGNEQLRAKRPDLHAWTTSSSWDSKEIYAIDDTLKTSFVMNAKFIKEIHGNIYEAKVNGFIPWAVIQRAAHWNKPDPNPGSAFRVYEDGTFEIKKGYYYYKQVCQAGHKGMHIVEASAMDSEISIIAFSKENTTYRDAFVVTNTGSDSKIIDLSITGLIPKNVIAFRTVGSEVYEYYTTAKKSNLEGENYQSTHDFALNEGVITYTIPSNSSTTFFISTDK